MILHPAAYFPLSCEVGLRLKFVAPSCLGERLHRPLYRRAMLVLGLPRLCGPLPWRAFTGYRNARGKGRIIC